MPVTSAADLLTSVDAVWRPFDAVVARLEDSAFAIETAGGWTAGELLAHIAFWDEALVPVVETIFRVGTLPPGWAFGSGYTPGAEWPAAGIHNSREAAWARKNLPGDIRARLHAAHEGLIVCLATVTDGEAEAQASYFSRLPAHYGEHLPELAAMAGARSA